MTGLQWLTHDDFANRVGERFDLSTDDGSGLALELVETEESAEPGGPGPEGQERRQFSLTFRGPAEPLLSQGTYDLGHPDLGDLALFLVPLGRDAQGTTYQAAFA